MSVYPILGWSRGDHSRSPIIYPGEASLLCSAETGSGKTRSVALPNLVRYEGSMVVADFQDGQLTRTTALWRSEMLRHEVIVFDPFMIIDPKFLGISKEESGGD